jgi:hypothetical protein
MRPIRSVAFLKEQQENPLKIARYNILFPTLFYHIHLNPGFFIVGAVHDSINGDQII